MTLNHPSDLAAWQAWESSRHRVKGVLRAVRDPRRLLSGQRSTESAGTAMVHWRGTPTLLLALDSTSITSRLALLDPVRDLPDVAIIAHVPLRDLGLDDLAFDDLGLDDRWSTTSVAVDRLGEVEALDQVRLVLSAGHYLPLGAAAHALAERRDLERAVVQHGLLTPFAPPLPDGAHLLAWSAADADFWTSGRRDVSSSVVGSALLGRAPSAVGDADSHVSRFTRPTFLGQLHSAELGRAQMTWAATDFCLRVGADYRPHPSEIDAASRHQHRLWQRLGMTVTDTSTPVTDLATPVVSVFSTGVLEAAARGVPAWVHHPRPPVWLQEFWQRYRLHRWTDAPTPPPDVSHTGATARTAEWLTSRQETS